MNDNDIELLYKSAVSIGHEVVNLYKTRGGLYIIDEKRTWNPLNHDSDAFSLAVKHRININFNNRSVWAKFSDLPDDCHYNSVLTVLNNNWEFTTRRVIVIATYNRFK